MLLFHFHCFQLSMGSFHTVGGGEDVDFALRVADASNGGKLIKVPEACVVHPFWPGRVFELMSHFFNWAIGDGGLLKRHPEHHHCACTLANGCFYSIFSLFSTVAGFISYSGGR